MIEPGCASGFAETHCEWQQMFDDMLAFFRDWRDPLG